MNLRQPPLSAELGTRGVMWLKTTLISHLYTGETFRQDKTKKNQQQDPPPRTIDRGGNVQSKHGQVVAVESVVIGCHLSSAGAELKNQCSLLGPNKFSVSWIFHF